MTRYQDEYDSTCKILAVDDDATARMYYQHTLSTLDDVEIVVAKNGQEAINIAMEQEFALVLLDVSMPGIDGFETALQILQTQDNTHTPILFISAHNISEQDAFKGYDHGAVDYIIKPVDTKVLKPKVAKLVELYKAHKLTQEQLTQTKKTSDNISQLLAAARAVLEIEDFTTSARKVYDASKQATGATAGYVALLPSSGDENEVLFLDAGDRPCSVDPNLPMPIRGLRAEAYAEKHTVFDNDFTESAWMEFIPAGHVRLDNVLFAPLVIAGKVEGVLGLANKPGGFTPEDVDLATAFGDFAAIALNNARTLELLKENREHLLQAQTQAEMGSFIRHLPSGETEWSDGMRAILGWKNDHTEHIEAIENILRQAQETEELVESRINLPQEDGSEKPLLLSVKTGRDARGDKRLVGTCLDMTKQKNLFRKLSSRQRLQAVGQLAGGLAHEINTPIQYAINNLDFFDKVFDLMQAYDHDLRAALSQEGDVLPRLQQLIESQSPAPYMAEVSAALHDIRDGLSRIDSTVSAVQKLTPIHRGLKKLTDVNQVIRELVKVPSKNFAAIAITTLNLAPDLPKIMASPGELHLAILNILVNGYEALQVDHDTQNKKGAIHITTAMDGPFVSITIKDNGPGIPAELHDRLFDPFFTTKTDGRGIGLSLSMSHYTIQEMGGAIEFSSCPETGTTFTLRFPATSSAPGENA